MKEIKLNNIEEIIQCLENEEEINFSISWNGEFANEITSILEVYGYNESKKKVLKNTLLYIHNNMQQIYENMLSALLPTLINWGMCEKNGSGKKVMSVQELDAAKYENDFIDVIQINCEDEIDGYAYYSIIFSVDYRKFGYDDGMEVVFFKDKVIYWSDGNTREYLFEFREHKGESTYLG